MPGEAKAPALSRVPPKRREPRVGIVTHRCTADRHRYLHNLRGRILPAILRGTRHRLSGKTIHVPGHALQSQRNPKSLIMPVAHPTSSETSTVTRPRIGLPLIVLFVLTITAQLVGLAFGRVHMEQGFASLILPSVLALSVITLPALWIGLALGPSVGLGAPLIAGESDIRKRLGRDVLLAGVLGVALGGLLIVIRHLSAPYLPPDTPVYGHRGFVGGLAVSFGAAVAEEVWFRLGLMTLLVWGAARIFSNRSPRPAIVWTVILVCAIAFGMAHLPQLISYGAGSPFAISGTVAGNTAVGILYGWCYWKRSLIAAMVAHFSVDIVIHALPALWL